MEVGPLPELRGVGGTGAAERVYPARFGYVKLSCDGGGGEDDGAGQVDGVEGVHQQWVGEADHPVLAAHGPNRLLILACAVAPGIFLRGSDLAELSVQLCALFVVGFEALATVCAECILVQWIHMYGRADLVDGAEVCSGVSGETLPESGDRTIAQVTARGRED